MSNLQQTTAKCYCTKTSPTHISFAFITLFGALCLISGLCIVLVWSVAKNIPSNANGLRVGASLSAIGGFFLLLSLVILFRWQIILRRSSRLSCQHHQCRSGHKHGHLYQVKLPNPDDLEAVDQAASHGGTLKKAKSAVYISFETVSPEKVKLLGLLHDTLSTMNLNELVLASSTIHKPRTTNDFDQWTSLGEQFTSSSHRYIRPAFQRDKSLRRSLPRVLFRAPIKLSRPCSSSESRSDQLFKAKSELQVQPKPDVADPSSFTHGNDFKPTRNITDLVQHSDTVKITKTLPLTGQASLFNLDNTISGVVENGSSVQLTGEPQQQQQQQQPSSSTVDAGSSGNKKYVLMKDTGQMISCTTLFGTSEDIGLDMEPGAGDCGHRHLQHCPDVGGWNVLPVFLEPHLSDTTIHTDDEYGVGEFGTIKSPRVVSRDEPSVEPNVKTGWFNRLRYFVRSRLSSARAVQSIDSPTMFVDQSNLETIQSMNSAKQTSANRHRKRSHSNKPSDDIYSTHREEMDEETHHQKLISTDGAPAPINRKHTVTSNASVFSLPAIPLELWTAEQPVWIMGVPVDENQWVALDTACDVILLERDQQKAGSASPMLIPTQTGSNSSMFAFHVKPPSRLKAPTRIGRIRYGRACSLGRILSDKRSA